MKVIHILIGLILFAVLFAASIFVLARVFEGAEAWLAFVESLKQARISAAAAGLGLALLLVLYVVTAIPLPRKAQYIAYDIEGSSVSISLRAVEDFLGRLAQEFASIDDLKSTLSVRNGTVDVQMDVKVKAGAQIPELCRMLQERARTVLREKVGLSDIGEVRVRVQEITDKPAPEPVLTDRADTFAT
ncbi:MAG: alkaline shock response membrane anchor protein AmaP [Kiritimatiellae bacterium]|nr:alkaline shock response membrane anchor protein AmaP [Kiritimatiellia bacterium]MDW8458098.1 hypothetical protein [Verrucomicrobiota bacterium]